MHRRRFCRLFNHSKLITSWGFLGLLVIQPITTFEIATEIFEKHTKNKILAM
jgi:hypothetical protein